MYDEKPDNRKAKITVSIATVSVVVIALVLIGLYENAQNKTTASSTATSSKVASSSSSTASASGSYKDGTYSVTTAYYVPHGKETIKVTITLKDGTVTDSAIENSENDPESARFQEDFAAEYKSNVVGKKINSVDVSYVAGASDTAQGFDDALAQIVKQAQA